jgi:hypothetical protein
MKGDPVFRPARSDSCLGLIRLNLAENVSRDGEVGGGDEHLA